jgi:hypothetical protein
MNRRFNVINESLLASNELELLFGWRHSTCEVRVRRRYPIGQVDCELVDVQLYAYGGQQTSSHTVSYGKIISCRLAANQETPS